jgi:hypothetical protein
MPSLKLLCLSLILITTSVQAANEFRFYCSGTMDEFNGFLKLETHVEAYMTIQDGKATLHGHDFSYRMLDADDIWSQFSIESEDVISNNPNYRPRVYKEHYQFDISKEVDGKVKLLIPFIAGKTYDGHFTAILIFTHIEDHAGDSVKLQCSID